jgi:zinc and cadmium transporter
MLGVSLLHLVPHALLGGLNAFAAMGWLLGGFLAMFFLERALPFHHHDVHHAEPGAAKGVDEHHGPGHAHGGLEDAAGTGRTACEHEAGSDRRAGHGDHGTSQHGLPVRRGLTWGAALAGLSLHSALDGMALAASTSAEEGTLSGPGGLGVFLAVVLHKPFDALTLGTLMAVAGGSKRLRHLVNAAYSLAVPAGALAFLLASHVLANQGRSLTAPALAFAAGMFLCIATADLLPELHFHAHDRIKLSVALALGVLLAAGIVAWEETYHEHSPQHDHSPQHEHHVRRAQHADHATRPAAADGAALHEAATLHG